MTKEKIAEIDLFLKTLNDLEVKHSEFKYDFEESFIADDIFEIMGILSKEIKSEILDSLIEKKYIKPLYYTSGEIVNKNLVNITSYEILQIRIHTLIARKEFFAAKLPIPA